MRCPKCGSGDITEYFNVEVRTHFYEGEPPSGPMPDYDNQMDRHFECRSCDHDWQEE